MIAACIKRMVAPEMANYNSAIAMQTGTLVGLCCSLPREKMNRPRSDRVRS
jgi:hypothetical protein